MPQKMSALVVGAKRNGYRRAGLQFGESSAVIPLSALTRHQVKELTTDRMLDTQEVAVFAMTESEYIHVSRKEAFANALIALLPADFQFVDSPVEYVTHLQEQVRTQTERADALQVKLDARPVEAPTKPAHTKPR